MITDKDYAKLRFGKTIVELFRNLREWLVETQGTQVADRVLPDFTTGTREGSVRKSQSPGMTPSAYAASHQDRMMVFEQDYDRAAGLKAPRQTVAGNKEVLKGQRAVFAERQQTARDAGIVAAIDELVKQRRILPHEQAAVIAFAQSIGADAVLEFGEGTTRKKQNASAWFLEFLKRLPVRPESRLVSMPYSVPSGCTVDPQRLALHRQALVYAEQYETDYLTAVIRLS